MVGARAVVPPVLHGREAELSVIEELLATVRAGGSGALVVRGEPGIGKTALLECAAAGDGVRVLEGGGVESEAELSFAGLHGLLRPVLYRVDALPGIQADALRGALGLAPVSAPDRFLVGLAVLSLLSELSEDGPLLAVVDDAQWLDRASVGALLFAARRLDAEAVGIIFAARDGFAAPGLPELRLRALDTASAATLLAEHDAGLGPAARYRVLATAAGNPLALMELPHTMSGQADPAVAPPLTDRLRDAFQAQVRRLPESVRTMLLVAALDDTGELDVVLRAAAQFGASASDLDADGLIRLTANRRITFRHPLVRAAVQQGAPVGRRMAMHAALADALDRPGDADRRAWHRASAVTGPDEEVAAELERTAVWAGERSGHAAAAAAYERAAQLTAEPGALLRRLVLAAEAAVEAGDLDRSDALAAFGARVTDGDPRLRARLTEVQAGASFWRGSRATAYGQFMRGAELALPDDPGRAVSMLGEAVHVGWYTGERELAEAVGRLRAVASEDPVARLLLLGTTPTLGTPTLGKTTLGKTTLEGAPGESDPEAVMAAAQQAAGDSGTSILVAGLGLLVGQEAVTVELAARQVDEARRQGRVGWLPQALNYLACGLVFAGWHPRARDAADEAAAIARDTDQRHWTERLREPQALLAALAGDEESCRGFVDDALAGAAGDDPTWGIPWVYWALGLLDLALGRAEQAVGRLASLDKGRARFHVDATRSTPDLVEAAVRAGRPEAATQAMAYYEQWARHIRQPWAEAMVLRCRALLGPDADAGETYAAALECYGPVNRPFDRARTTLLYGEWLRRARRRSEASVHLRAALEDFERLGATPWAARARTELGATGTTVSPEPAAGILADLTPQERQIVRLAARGLSNKEIAAKLFLSPRTVGYHLYKAYPKLGVLSRGELAALDLADSP